MIDPYSPTWNHIQQALEKKRGELVERLIRSAEKDEYQRGQIQLIEEILKWPDPDKPDPLKPTSYL